MLEHVFTLEQLDNELKLTLSAVAVWLMWFQFLYFFKLIENTAFFATLVYQTLYDMIFFLLIFFLVLFPFSNAIYILNTKRNVMDEDSSLYPNAFGQGGEEASAIMYQYLLALGEFHTDNFYHGKGEDAPILWVFFIISTFLSTVIMLNMMIAIMGETFNTLNAISDQVKLRAKYIVCADYAYLLIQFNEMKKKFIFLLRPKAEEDESDANLSDLRTFIEEKNDAARQEITEAIQIL
jgi:hypothetical protein